MEGQRSCNLLTKAECCSTGCVRNFMQPVLIASAEYQKYLLSKLVLTHGENFYLSPAPYDVGPMAKVQEIKRFFSRTLRQNVNMESEHLYHF